MKKLEHYKIGDIVATNNYFWRYEEANKSLLESDFDIETLFEIANTVDKWFLGKDFGMITGIKIHEWHIKYVVNDNVHFSEWLFLLDNPEDWKFILEYIIH